MQPDRPQYAYRYSRIRPDDHKLLQELNLAAQQPCRVPISHHIV